MAENDGATDGKQGKRRGGRGAKGSAAEGGASSRRSERRFEPKTSAGAALAVLGASLASVALGAGVYGQWLRSDELGPSPYAPYLLLGGGVVLVVLALFGPRPAAPLRVGDAGVAREKDGGELDRIGWNEVTRLLLTKDTLTFESSGAAIAIPLATQPQAAAYALAQARKRIPARAKGVEGDVAALDEDAGEVLPLEHPQVAGLRCKSSDKLISFEREARLCARCGEIFHKDGVPERCVTCGAPLKG